MKTALKIGKRILMVLATMIIILAVVRSVGMGINKRTPKGGINESFYVDINGNRQWINIYGQDRDNPVLLYLHGGPGSATSPVDYSFTRKWSDVYTVVTWDQRNVGKSFDKKNISDKITKDIMMADGKAMTEFLLSYMGKEKITLLGHSWGSMFGANLSLEYPQYYDAFIGTGQCIDIYENETRLYAAAKEWTNGDAQGEALLEKWSPENADSLEAMSARSKIMDRYGYGMMKDGQDYNMIATILFNPNYMVKDYIGYVKNIAISMDPYMSFFAHGLYECSLSGKYDYKVPYYNINGDMDYQTNYDMACEYFEKVNAPDKKMYVMKNATHGLLESRSEEFSEYVHDIANQMGKK